MLSRRVARALETERELVDREYVFRQGDVGGEMYIIRSGTIRITRHFENREHHIADLKRGEFFGEMSLLESLPREADARAVGETTLLVLGSGALLLRLRRDPSFAIEMLRKLSARIRRINAELGTALEGID